MAGTLGDLKSRIALELARTDLSAQIANAVNDAIKHYSAERFWFNQSRNLMFSTVPSQQAYGVNDADIIPRLIKIDQFMLQDATQYPLDRYSATDWEMVNSGHSGGGRPFAFTYTDQQILIYPVPSAAYTMRLYAHFRLPALTDDNDSNAWTDDAERLIRAYAKQLLYLDTLEDDQGATRMQPIIESALSDLRTETSARMGTGRIRPTQF